MKIDPHYFFLAGSVLVASVSQVLLKKGALNEYQNWIRQYLNPWVIGGYLLMFASVFFKEKLTARKLVGIGCIVLGMAVFYIG